MVLKPIPGRGMMSCAQASCIMNTVTQMVRHGNTSSRWFALLSLGAAFVFLWCHTLGAGTFPGGNPAIYQTDITANYVDGRIMVLCGVSDDCAVALTEFKAFAGMSPPSSTAISTAALFPLPLPSLPSWDVLHATPTIVASHRSSLLNQAVLLRI